MKNEALVLGGQGTQYPGMGKNLYDKYQEVRNIFEIVSSTVGFDVSKICFDSSNEELIKPLYTQLSVLTLELSIYEMLKNNVLKNINGVSGFSLGEYTALSVSGILTIEQVVNLVYSRALCIEKCTTDDMGIMIAVINMNELTLNEICRQIGYDNVNVSIYNSSKQTVVSAKMSCVDKFIKKIRDWGGIPIKLNVSRPYHHIMMKSAADMFLDTLTQTKFQSMKMPVYFNCIGNYCNDSSQIINMLYKQLFKPVLWKQTIENMVSHGFNKFYEVSPKPILYKILKDIVGDNADVLYVDYKKHLE